MTKEEIASTMRALVADRLAAPLDKVTPESRLIPDLGADSLDIMDLLFAIKGKFQVDIRPDELNFAKPLAGAASPFLPREAVEKLKDWLPALEDVPDPDKVTAATVFRSISVGTLGLLVERKLAGQA
ncbi:MAG: acyl carrier protein [Elusimicrobia bacterium]|nr:acyl carrier protein [Elusimicrobiota bacterium]